MNHYDGGWKRKRELRKRLGSEVYRRDVTVGIGQPQWPALAYLLQHRISLQFLEHRRVGDAQNVVNDVNEAVG